MKRKLTFVTLGQSIYLSSKFFVKNNLVTYAGNSSLAFLFSFMPILMMIIIVLVKIFHTSPDLIFSFVDIQSIFAEPIKIKNLVDNLLNAENSGLITIITVLFILWMAQRLFFSIVSGIRNIFHASTIQPIKKQRGKLVERLFIILGEIVLVVLVGLLLTTTKSLKSLIENEELLTKILVPYFPQAVKVFLSNLFSILINLIPFIFMFLLESFLFRFASGTKPKWKYCFLSSLNCTILFWFVTVFFKLFLNITRYNLVYGVLSNLVITLLEIYIFFILFFLSAQFIFVKQFFKELLLSELYLLPSDDVNDIKSKIKRKLFIRPDKLISNENMHISLSAGEKIYNENDISDGLYYVAKGKIKLSKENYEQDVSRGNFFGDYECILEQNRVMNATAITDSLIILISKDEFYRLLQSNPEVSQKMLESLPSYILKIYGRKQFPMI